MTCLVFHACITTLTHLISLIKSLVITLIVFFSLLVCFPVRNTIMTQAKVICGCAHECVGECVHECECVCVCVGACVRVRVCVSMCVFICAGACVKLYMY